MQAFFSSRLMQFGAIVFATCFMFTAWAGDDYRYHPQELLEHTTETLLDRLAENRDDNGHDPHMLYEIITDVLIPHVDFGYMSRWILGRKTWSKIDRYQRKEFADAFRDLLIHTYANVLNEYADESITYMPYRGDPNEKKRVQISSRITQKGHEPIHVVYRLLRKRSGEWYVYDIVIEGVSLLKGFQSQFQDQIDEKGFDVFLDELKGINEENREKFLESDER